MQYLEKKMSINRVSDINEPGVQLRRPVAELCMDGPKIVKIQDKTLNQNYLDMVANRFSNNEHLTSQIAQNENEIAFFSSISFLTRSMQVFGLYFVVNDLKKHKGGDDKRCTGWSAGRVYSALVLVILWLNLARVMSCLSLQDVWGPSLLFKLYSLLVLIATNLMMTCHYAAYSNGKLNRLLGEISRYNSEEKDDLELPFVADEEMINVETPSPDTSGVSTDVETNGIVPSMNTNDGSNKSTQVERLSADIALHQSQEAIAKRYSGFLHAVIQPAFICSLTAWTVFLLKVTVIFYVLFWTNYFDNHMTPINKYVTVSKELTLLVRISVLIIYTYSHAAGSFTATMSFLFALLFWQGFRSFNSRFKAAIHGRQFEGEFELYRLRHQRLSHLVEKADKMLWLCNGSNFVCHSVSTIVLLYGLIFYQQFFHSTLLTCLVIFYLLTSVFEIGLTSLGPLLVNNVVIVLN